MNKYILMISAAFLLCTTAAQAQDSSGTIDVGGSGHAVATPDTAYIVVSISGKAASPQPALDKGAEIVGSITRGLAGIGIEERDVQTNALNLQPSYKPADCDRAYYSGEEPCVFDGFAVDTELTIRLRDLVELAPALNLLGGAEIERINSISLAVADPQPYRDAAYAAALLDAKRIAVLTATTLDVELGHIVSTRESGYQTPAAPAMLRDGVVYYTPSDGMADLGVLVARGELTFNSSVSMTWSVSERE